jgi:ribosomal protein S4
LMDCNGSRLRLQFMTSFKCLLHSSRKQAHQLVSCGCTVGTDRVQEQSIELHMSEH